MYANEILNPRLIISEHFYKVKNDLDIKIETIFDQNRKMNEEKRNQINAIRQSQIKKIEQIEQRNLAQWPIEFDREKFQFEWQDLFGKKSLSDKQKFNKVKESLIKRDAILINDSNLVTETCLWEMPFFVNEGNLKFAQ